MPAIRSESTSVVALATTLTVATTLPVALVGVIADAAGRDLAFGASAVGLIVAAFWASSSVVSMCAGGFVSRHRTRSIAALSALLALVSAAGSALVSPSWHWLLLWAAVGGAANALAHPGTNTDLQRSVPAERRAFAFGLKQAAVPAASIITGASLPLIASTFGWRWAFVPAIVLAGILAAGAFATRSRSAPVDVRPHLPAPRSSYPFLAWATITTLLGAAHANAMGAFVVVSALDRGLDAAIAGALLVASSVLAALVRMVAGVLADRGIGGSFAGVAALLALGTVGLVLMASPSPACFVVGCLAAFVGSFGWPGLVHYVVSREMGEATAAGTTITQTGSYVGSTLGPLGFGVLFAVLGASLPWFGMALVAVLGAVAAVLAHRAALRMHRAALIAA